MKLESLEDWAARHRRLLRLQVRRRLGIWTLRVGVARPGPGNVPQLLGELKAWALPREGGLHLDTLRVVEAAGGVPVGPLIWAATFAWALEATPCRRAELLAIHDGERQHRILVRYFRRLGFLPLRPIGAAPRDLPLRLLWGGSGLLMRGDCTVGLERSLAWLGAEDGKDDGAQSPSA